MTHGWWRHVYVLDIGISYPKKLGKRTIKNQSSVHRCCHSPVCSCKLVWILLLYGCFSQVRWRFLTRVQGISCSYLVDLLRNLQNKLFSIVRQRKLPRREFTRNAGERWWKEKPGNCRCKRIVREHETRDLWFTVLCFCWLSKSLHLFRLIVKEFAFVSYH